MKRVSLVIITILMTSVFVCAIRVSNAFTLEVGSGKAYSTIQSAINAAGPGDTVLVYPGTYNEEVAISKQLNVTSVGGATQTFIDGSTGVTLTSAGLVKITAGANVTFSGFTVENAPLDPSNNAFGILSESTTSSVTFLVSNNKIIGTGDTNPADFEVGFYSQNDQANIIFKYNNITNMGGNNIVFEVHTGATEISYNHLEAGLGGGDSVFFMTYNAADVTTLQNVSGNTFNMGTGVFDYVHRSTGISITTPGAAYGVGDAKFTNVRLQGNVFNNVYSNRRGIGFWNGGGEGGGTIAPIIQNDVVNGVSGSANSSGVDFIGAGAAQNATLAYNTVSNCDAGVYLRTAGSAPGLKVNYNSLVGNNVGLNNTLGPSNVDARFNYWGDSSGPGGSGPGTGQPILGLALFDPWLSSYQVPAWTQVGTNPDEVEKYAFPGIEGVTFNVTITVQNVTDLYGFEFNLTWDSSLINLVGVEYTPELNQMWGSSWTKAYENITQNGWYDLVAVALAPAKGYKGYATLATLTFRVAYGPCYIATNYTLQTRLHFSTIKLSDSNAQPIGAIVNDGNYLIHAVQPLLEITPATLIGSKLNQTTTIQIKIVDAFKVFGIDLQIKYNTTLLKLNSIQWNDLSGFLPGPYIVQTYTVDSVNGLIRFTVAENLTAGAPLGYGDRPLVNVTFAVIKTMIWKNSTGWTNYLEDSVIFTDWNVSVCSPATHSLTGNLVLVSNATYCYVPIQGDVDSNGLVDIFDLSNVAKYYGIKNTDPRYVADYDLNNDGIIDLYDIVIIATNFGYKYNP
jgi:hypothetical protein